MQAFISYAFADKDIMNKLRTSLGRKGIQCYVAEHDTRYGEPLSEKLENSILNSDARIVIITKNSVGSPSVNQEIGRMFWF